MGRELRLSDVQHRQRFDASSVVGLALRGQPETARGPIHEARSKPRFHQSDRFTNGGRGYPQPLRRPCETPRLSGVREGEKALEATRLDHSRLIYLDSLESRKKLAFEATADSDGR
jgi:hypothetical protein